MFLNKLGFLNSQNSTISSTRNVILNKIKKIVTDLCINLSLKISITKTKKKSETKSAIN